MTDEPSIRDQIVNLLNRAEYEAFENGETQGRADQSLEDYAETQAVVAAVRRDLTGNFHSAAQDAHHEAGHCGPWEMCPDAVCAALERWLHHETRPVGAALPLTEMESMTRG